MYVKRPEATGRGGMAQTEEDEKGYPGVRVRDELAQSTMMPREYMTGETC